jgi:endonuclease/exonuclease/phosphatase family metal-dependent hydrolase
MIRFISWNMSHWQRTASQRDAAWAYLESLSPDVAMLQEAVPPERLDKNTYVYRPGGIGPTRKWGSMLVSYLGPVAELTHVRASHSRKAADLQRTYPGSLAIAEIGGLVAGSWYGLIEDGYAITTVHRQLSDLTPLVDSPLGDRLVFAGDLNISSQFKGVDGRRHRNLLERFATLDLVDCLAMNRPARERLANCPCADESCLHVQTQRHPRSAVPWQNDYFFVSKKLAAKVRSCYAVEGEVAWHHSGHRPIALELTVKSPPPN